MAQYSDSFIKRKLIMRTDNSIKNIYNRIKIMYISITYNNLIRALTLKLLKLKR